VLFSKLTRVVLAVCAGLRNSLAPGHPPQALSLKGSRALGGLCAVAGRTSGLGVLAIRTEITLVTMANENGQFGLPNIIINYTFFFKYAFLNQPSWSSESYLTLLPLRWGRRDQPQRIPCESCARG
jgi:hypothetical protein